MLFKRFSNTIKVYVQVIFGKEKVKYFDVKKCFKLHGCSVNKAFRKTRSIISTAKAGLIINYSGKALATKKIP